MQDDAPGTSPAYRLMNFFPLHEGPIRTLLQDSKRRSLENRNAAANATASDDMLLHAELPIDKHALKRVR